MSEYRQVRADLAQHLRDGLPLPQDRVVERARTVDVGGRPLVQLALDSVTQGSGEEYLRVKATVLVWVVQPGDSEAVDDKLDDLLGAVLDVIDAVDDTTWTEARRTAYPPGNPTHPAYLVTATREV